MWCVADVEADSLTPTQLWVIVCKDIETGKIYEFRRPDLDPQPFLDFAQHVEVWIGHNFLGYDLWAILSLVPNSFIDPESVIDTLVVSRLLDYDNQGYGHSLEEWGTRLGSPKIEFNDFSQLTQQMVDYCIQDVEVTFKLFQRFKPYIESSRWRDALRLEHDMAVFCHDLHQTGFYFDKEKALRIHTEVCDELQKLDKDLLTAYPPRAKPVREVTPKLTKKGQLKLSDFRWINSDGDQLRRSTSDLRLLNADVVYELGCYSADCPFTVS